MFRSLIYSLRSVQACYIPLMIRGNLKDDNYNLPRSLSNILIWLEVQRLHTTRVLPAQNILLPMSFYQIHSMKPNKQQKLIRFSRYAGGRSQSDLWNTNHHNAGRRYLLPVRLRIQILSLFSPPFQQSLYSSPSPDGGGNFLELLSLAVFVLKYSR